MQRIFSFLALILFSGQAMAQSPLIPIGFVNAVGLETKTDVRIDGVAVKPTGFDQGRFAEGFGVQEGKHRFTFSNESCDPLAQDVEVRNGSPNLYVLYLAPQRNIDGTFKNTLKLSIISNQTRTQARTFLGYYASVKQAATLRVNNTDVTLKALQLIPLGEGSLTVQTGPRPVHYKPTTAANYVLVVFDGNDSRLRQSFVELNQ